MYTHLHRGGWLPGIVLSLAVSLAFMSGSPAFAKGGGGGGHGGGGHGHGGHGGHGHHYGWHHGGYYHHSGYHHNYYYGGNGYYSNGYVYYWPNTNYYYPTTTYSYPVYSYPAYSYVSPYPTGAVNVVSSQGRFLGIDEQAVLDSGGPGMQVLRVTPGSPAEKAGLKPGDVIRSINGYLMQQHGNIAWIIANTPANGVLQITVRSAGSVADRVVNATIP